MFCQKYTGVTKSMGFVYISLVLIPAVQRDSRHVCVHEHVCVCVCVSWVMDVRAKRRVRLQVHAGCVHICLCVQFVVCMDEYCGVYKSITQHI